MSGYGSPFGISVPPAALHGRAFGAETQGAPFPQTLHTTPSRHRKALSDTSFLGGYALDDLQGPLQYGARGNLLGGGVSATAAGQGQQMGQCPPVDEVNYMDLDRPNNNMEAGRLDASFATASLTARTTSFVSYHTHSGSGLSVDPTASDSDLAASYLSTREADGHEAASSRAPQHQGGRQTMSYSGGDYGAMAFGPGRSMQGLGPGGVSMPQHASSSSLSLEYLPGQDAQPGGSSAGRNEGGAVGAAAAAAAATMAAVSRLPRSSKAEHGRSRRDTGKDKARASNGRSERELVLLDPKRVRRIIANRESAAKSKERKQQYMEQLETALTSNTQERDTLRLRLERAVNAGEALAAYSQARRAEGQQVRTHIGALQQQNQALLQQLYAAQEAAGKKPQPPQLDAAAAAAAAAAAGATVAELPDLLALGLADPDESAFAAQLQAAVSAPMGQDAVMLGLQAAAVAAGAGNGLMAAVTGDGSKLLSSQAGPHQAAAPLLLAQQQQQPAGLHQQQGMHALAPRSTSITTPGLGQPSGGPGRPGLPPMPPSLFQPALAPQRQVPHPSQQHMHALRPQPVPQPQPQQNASPVMTPTLDQPGPDFFSRSNTAHRPTQSADAAMFAHFNFGTAAPPQPPLNPQGCHPGGLGADCTGAGLLGQHGMGFDPVGGGPTHGSALRPDAGGHPSRSSASVSMPPGMSAAAFRIAAEFAGHDQLPARSGSSCSMPGGPNLGIGGFKPDPGAPMPALGMGLSFSGRQVTTALPPGRSDTTMAGGVAPGGMAAWQHLMQQQHGAIMPHGGAGGSMGGG